MKKRGKERGKMGKGDSGKDVSVCSTVSVYSRPQLIFAEEMKE